MKGHEVKGVNVSGTADVPFNRRRWALKGDVVTDAIRLSLFLPPHDLDDRLHPLAHRFTWKTEYQISVSKLACLIEYVCMYEHHAWTLSIFRVCVHTSKLCGAGEVFFKSTAEFRIILKVIKVMFYPLTEYIQNPNDTHTDIRPMSSQTLIVLMDSRTVCGDIDWNEHKMTQQQDGWSYKNNKTFF